MYFFWQWLILHWKVFSEKGCPYLKLNVIKGLHENFMTPPSAGAQWRRSPVVLSSYLNHRRWPSFVCDGGTWVSPAREKRWGFKRRQLGIVAHDKRA